MKQEDSLEKFLLKSVNRCQAIKAGGLASLILIFSKLLIEGIRPTLPLTISLPSRPSRVCSFDPDLRAPVGWLGA